MPVPRMVVIAGSDYFDGHALRKDSVQIPFWIGSTLLARVGNVAGDGGRTSAICSLLTYALGQVDKGQVVLVDNAIKVQA